LVLIIFVFLSVFRDWSFVLCGGLIFFGVGCRCLVFGFWFVVVGCFVVGLLIFLWLLWLVGFLGFLGGGLFGFVRCVSGLVYGLGVLYLS